MPVVVTAGTPLAPELTATLHPRTPTLDTLDDLRAHMDTGATVHAVVFGPAVPLEEATAYADSIRIKHPDISVIVVRDKVIPTVLAACMDAGVRDVVDARKPERLGQAVARAQQVWSAIHGVESTSPPERGRLVTVFSPKGGVGKTTTAVNLALALSDGGARRVCLVDLDLAFGDVAITLQLFPHHTIYEAVPVEDHLDFEMLENLLTPHEDSLMVLAAPTQPDAKDRIRASLVGRVLRTLKDNFDYVVVDTAPSFEEHVLQAFDETDECVLVATLDVPTLKNVKIAMETLELLQVAPGHRWLVLNRADAEVGLSVEKVESILGLPVTVGLPTALEVASATNSGRPILLSHPDHTVSRELKALAGRITGAPPPVEPTRPAESKPRRFARSRR